jgi:hypothetical protein
MASEREKAWEKEPKKVWADDLPFVSPFFSARGGVLPTPEQERQAMQQTMRDVIGELYRPQYQSDSARDTRRPPGTNGWLAEQPLTNADTDRANKLIEGICNAGLPQPTPRVNIQSLRAFEPSVVRAKLEEAVAKGTITREQVDAVMSSLRKEGV